VAVIQAAAVCEDYRAVARDLCSSYMSLPNVTQRSTERLTVVNLDVDSVSLETHDTVRVDIYCKYIKDCDIDDQINPLRWRLKDKCVLGRCNIISRKNSALLSTIGRSFKPSILTAFRHHVDPALS